MASINDNGAPPGVVAVGASAAGVGPGALNKRNIDIADEAEQAMEILGRRLSAATSGTGERGGG